MKSNEEIAGMLSEKNVEAVKAILRKYPFQKLKKPWHYKFSILEKDTDEEKLKNVYEQYDRIDTVLLRTKTKGNKKLISYDIYYTPDEGEICYLSLAMNLLSEPPILFNGYFENKDYNNFRKRVLKRYAKSMI